MQRTERITVPELHGRMEADAWLQLLDVRDESEWRAGHIPGSMHVPYHDIDHVPPSIDPSRPVAAVCESGPRSAVAASLLQRHGVGEVLHVVDGGVRTWRERGWPMG